MLLEFIDYFRQIAVKHKELQHNPDSEQNDAIPGSCHFATQTYMETFTGGNTRYGYPILLVNIPATDLNGADIYNINVVNESAFFVLVRAENKGEYYKNQALAKAEKITYDILAKIYNDHYGKGKERCKTPFEYFEFKKIPIDSVGPLDNGCYGWTVEFSFRLHNQFDISKMDSSQWLVDSN